jgi:hypothetical protein
MQTKYGFSQRHDAALDACITSGKPCPFGCVKDGAPNCNAHVIGHYGIEQCEFGRLTAHLVVSGFVVDLPTQAHLTQRAPDVLKCGHNQGVEFGENSIACVVCGEPARR